MYKRQYFKTDKMRKCPCGCGFDMDDKALYYFNKAREISGIAYNINSGARCIQYNRNIGGVDNSAHTKGLAFDISFKNELEMLKIYYGLVKAGFNRIGVNFEDKFIHADIDDSLPTPAIFVY